MYMRSCARISLFYYIIGLLEAPTTEIATVNGSYLSFSWRAPFSLDITGVEPDIQFYTFRESLTGSSGNVTAVEEYVFPNVAVTVDFSASAWNVVGEGTQASETHQACSLTEGESLPPCMAISVLTIYWYNIHLVKHALSQELAPIFHTLHSATNSDL